MPLPGLDSTGRGPHTENAQSGWLSPQLEISHMQYVLQFAILCNFQKLLKRESFIPSSPSRLSQKHKQPAMFSCSTYMRAVRQQKAEQVIHSIYYNLGWGCAFLLQSSKQHRPTCMALFHISPAHPPSTPHCHFTYELLPASRRRERMEGG